MATKQGEKRGPRLGDSASLWNFTPSPGWTKEEAQILKLCLMKFGVGRWTQILETGLLPGKLIQQLNGQTQRLLGQQSLAAYTGLQVDIDSIREENERNTDAQRKGGLIIWSGANPTKKMKEEWQKEAKTKYGLGPEVLKDVEEQLEALAADVEQVGGTGTARNSRMPVISLMDSDLGTLSKEQKLQLLKRLRNKLKSLYGLYCKAKTGALPSQGIKAEPAQPGAELDTAAPAVDGTSAEANLAGERAAPTGKAAKEKANVKPKGTKKVAAKGASGSGSGSGAKRKSGAGQGGSGAPKQRKKAVKEIDEDEMDLDEDQTDAQQAVVEDEVLALQAMGFSRSKAVEALEHCNYDVSLATDWLCSNCL